MTVDEAVKALVTAHRAEESARCALHDRKRTVSELHDALVEAEAAEHAAAELLGARVRQRAEAESTLLRVVAEEGRQDGETPAGMASLNP